MGDMHGRYFYNVYRCGGGEAVDVSKKYLAMRSIRKDKKISTALVAMSVGMSTDRYIKIEQGSVKRVTATERAMIASFYQMPEDVLFRAGYEPVGNSSRCRTRTMPLDELEKMLATEFGSKLQPKRKMPCRS